MIRFAFTSGPYCPISWCCDCIAIILSTRTFILFLGQYELGIRVTRSYSFPPVRTMRYAQLPRVGETETACVLCCREIIWNLEVWISPADRSSCFHLLTWVRYELKGMWLKHLYQSHTAFINKKNMSSEVWVGI